LIYSRDPAVSGHQNKGEKMAQIVVDQEKCTKCGACVALCNSSNVYGIVDKVVQVVKPDECWMCGHCVAICPEDAIDHSEYPLSDCPGMDTSEMPSFDNLVAAFRMRRSARIFRKKPVSRETVKTLIEVARWVPSASNEQPVDWIAIDDPRKVSRISEKTVDVLVNNARSNAENLSSEEIAGYEGLALQSYQGIDPVFFKAPILLLAHVPEEDFFGRDDATYAAYNLMLAAEQMGLGTCLIGYYIYALGIRSELKEMLNLTKGRRVEVALVLGYPQYQFKRALPRREMEIVWNLE
jgi:nitroreductase/ferredoxin